MVVKMVDLYSYWMTAHFLIYKALSGKIPEWLSPYPTLFLGFFAQLYIFLHGSPHDEVAVHTCCVYMEAFDS